MRRDEKKKIIAQYFNVIVRSTYSKIETGTRNIRISEFLALKQIYNVDFSEFFIGLLPDSEK